MDSSLDDFGLSAKGSAYSPSDTETLRALCIDATHRSDEADSALLHIQWLEKKANLEWALSASAPEVAMYRQVMEKHFDSEATAKICLRGTFGIKVRDSNGILTPRFIEWYSNCCQYDPASPVRPYSAQAMARGDYPTDDDPKQPVTKPEKARKEMPHAKAIRRALGKLNTNIGLADRTTEDIWDNFLSRCDEFFFDEEEENHYGVDLISDKDERGRPCIKLKWREPMPGKCSEPIVKTVSRSSFDRYVSQFKKKQRAIYE